jgi:hypothetical protein
MPDDSTAAVPAPDNSAIDELIARIQEIFGNIVNAKWDDVREQIAAMDKLADSVDSSVRPVFDALYIPVKETALGFQQYVTAKTEEDTNSALAHLTLAKTALQRNKTENPKLAENDGYKKMVQAVEINLLNVQEQVARAHNDAATLELVKQQRNRLMDEIRDGAAPDDTMRFFYDAMKLYGVALQKFSLGMQHLVEMDLDLAQEYLGEASKSFDSIRELLGQTPADNLFTQAGKNAVEGFGELVTGQEIYVRVMRTAILGDVTRGDVEALEKAERAFGNGITLIKQAAVVFPSAFGDSNFEAGIKVQSRLVRNLRAMCERSLTPKVITAATTPKVFFYFVGTFLVLLVALPLSGLVAKLQTADLGLMMIVSLVVSLIGAFGFEATRLVPLLDVFSKWLPWGGQKGAKAEG